MQTNEEFIFSGKEGKSGQVAVDLTDLYSKTGIMCYDEGLQSTALFESSVCFIDGKHGILKYRDYDIQKLVQNNDLFDVAYLLIFGQLPDKKTKNTFKSDILRHMKGVAFLYPFVRLLDLSKSTIDNFKILFSAYTAQYGNVETKSLIYQLMADFPLLVYMACTKKMPVAYQDTFGSSFLKNYLKPEKINQNILDAFDKFLILHAEHEQNASTFIVQACEMTENNLLNCMLTGIASLEGQYHGGASEKAFTQLRDNDDMERLVLNAKQSGCKLAGFGHRIYKVADPRAVILKDLCKKINPEDKLLKKAVYLEDLVRGDDYFNRRDICPNLDLYSGIFLESLGIPANLSILMFIMARFIGWIAHYQELQLKPRKIIRPRQVY